METKKGKMRKGQEREQKATTESLRSVEMA